MKLVSAIFFTASLALSPTSAIAWGAVGHSIVCEIAFQELDDEARAEVTRLMGLDDDYRYFNESCNWPDHPRKRGSEHYVNLDRRADLLDPGEPCGDVSKCVVTAIMSDLNDLALGADDATKLPSLKFLGHWVGDVHQPLHVSFSDDRGGNSIRENGPCTGQLHRVWDTCIIEEALGRDPLEVAAELIDQISDQDRTQWTAGVDALDMASVVRWANESFEMATDPEVEYCVKRDGGCWYSDDIDQLGSDDAEKTVRVDAAYIARNSEKVAMRLKMAGVRLGALLNAVLKDNQTQRVW